MRKEHFRELLDELVLSDPEYDEVLAVCKECDEEYWVETPQYGMIEHCGNHPPLSEL